MSETIEINGSIKKQQKTLARIEITRPPEGVRVFIKSDFDFGILKSTSYYNLGGIKVMKPKPNINFDQHGVTFNQISDGNNQLFSTDGKLNLSFFLSEVPLNDGVPFILKSFPYSKKVLDDYGLMVKEKIKVIYQEIFSPVKFNVSVFEEDLVDY